MTPRMEYPRPQFVRDNWMNLNGTWQFAYDDEDRGLAEKWYKKDLPMEIIVPFVYQSACSGIGDRTPHEVVWYRKEIELEKCAADEAWILHFGAVDYQAKVFFNDMLIAEHTGGHVPFSIDVTPYLKKGRQTIALRVFDAIEDEEQPRGKQFWERESRSIWYTNSTGIWQTVWMEKVNKKRLGNVRITPLYDEGKVQIEAEGLNVCPEDFLNYEISIRGNAIAAGCICWLSNKLVFSVDLIQNHVFWTNFHGSDQGITWTPEYPNLLDLKLLVVNEAGEVTDDVTSYFGFRKIHTQDGMVYLNNRPYYQKLVLDQGYWPEGLLSAPTDEDYKKDIELSKAMGFNGCRKHQKTEDPRFLYWADKLGYLVWGECASAPMFSEKAASRLMTEWQTIIERDYNHPCIVAWVPMNESWGVPDIARCGRQQHFSQMMYHYCHTMDDTRLVVSNDGWEQTVTDICAIHNYTHGQKEEVQKYQNFLETLSDREHLLAQRPADRGIYANGFGWRGEPILLTEFGGIGFEVSAQKGWGYSTVNNEADFLEDYERIMDAIYASKTIWGYCYTQITDVEQEINGLLCYDRTPKCSLEAIKKINDKYHKPWIE